MYNMGYEYKIDVTLEYNNWRGSENPYYWAVLRRTQHLDKGDIKNGEWEKVNSGYERNPERAFRHIDKYFKK